jgi:rSAM/selenodomain-associated transferase 1
MDITPHSNAVALFVRHPVPGRVKTRLARDLGNENACALYQAMVKDILGSITASNLPLYLFHDGSDSGGLPEEWTAAACAVIAQQGDSLGARMAAAFEQLFANGIDHVALLGSDIPGLDAELLTAAFHALENGDSAIVPAVDGGYCLIALRGETYDHRVFQDIEWSTGSVLKSTLERMEQCGLRVTVLAPRQDIDTCDNLEAYCRNPSKTAHATNQWLADFSGRSV